MSEDDYKLEFAKLLQKLARDRRLESQPMIAKAVLGKDYIKYPQFLLRIADEWPMDPVVIKEVERLDMIIQPKEVILAELFRIGTDRFASNRDRVSALSEYCKTVGWTLPKADTGTKPLDRLEELSAMIMDQSNTLQLPKVTVN
jgi:hypothetical protein